MKSKGLKVTEVRERESEIKIDGASVGERESKSESVWEYTLQSTEYTLQSAESE